jgi:hypothetical protein
MVCIKSLGDQKGAQALSQTRQNISSLGDRPSNHYQLFITQIIWLKYILGLSDYQSTAPAKKNNTGSDIPAHQKRGRGTQMGGN